MKCQEKRHPKFILRLICSILFPKIVASLFVLAIMIMGIGSASGQLSPRVLIGAEYIISDATVTVHWDPVSSALGYEARLVLFVKDPVTFFAIAKVPNVENSVTFNRPRAGHFRAEVRAWNEATAAQCVDGDELIYDIVQGRCYTRWSLSTNEGDACVDILNDGNCVAMGWWLFWKLPKLPPLPL